MLGDESLRLFCALRLPERALDELGRWQRALDVPAGVRLLPRENLHVTLAFLGRLPSGDAARVGAELCAAAAATRPPRLVVGRYRETRSVGMLVLHEEQPAEAAALARDLHDRLERRGLYVREKRPWLPHVSVMRFRQPPRLRPELPELGVVAPSEAAVYLSRLRPDGAQYQVLESFPVGGSRCSSQQ